MSSLLRVFVSFSILVVASACPIDGDEEEPDSVTPSREVRSLEASLGQARAIGSGASGFLVTPRWSPNGDSLIASGHGGRGLYLIEPSSSTVRPLSTGFRAARRLIRGGDGDAIYLGDRAGERFLEVQLGARRARVVSKRPAAISPRLRLSDGEGDAEVIARQGERRIVFEPLRGRVAAVGPRGDEEVIAAHGAWGVTVSPNGGRIAYCLGHLVGARLFVHQRGGETRELGPGAHPAWHPDGRHLIFAAPETELDDAGALALAGSELFIIDVERGGDVQLTSTRGAWEMEPAVSPSGDAVAFSDWRSGVISVARLDLAPSGRRP